MRSVTLSRDWTTSSFWFDINLMFRTMYGSNAIAMKRSRVIYLASPNCCALKINQSISVLQVHLSLTTIIGHSICSRTFQRTQFGLQKQVSEVMLTLKLPFVTANQQHHTLPVTWRSNRPYTNALKILSATRTSIILRQSPNQREWCKAQTLAKIKNNHFSFQVAETRWL